MTLTLSKTVWSGRVKHWRPCRARRCCCCCCCSGRSTIGMEFLKYVMFSPRFPSLSSIVSAQELLALPALFPKETKDMGSLYQDFALSVRKERCKLDHVPFLINGSKFSFSLPFLILGYFSRCVSTIPKKWIYEQLSVIWDILSLPKEVVNITQYPRLIAVSWPSLLVWAQYSPKLRQLHDYRFGVSLCPTSLEYRKSSLMSAYTIPCWLTLNVFRSTSRLVFTKAQRACRQYEAFYQPLTIYGVAFCTTFHFS